MTFEPHPRSYFAPDAAPFRLMDAHARETRLAKLGIERLYQLNFNASLAALTPREFAQHVIVDGLVWLTWLLALIFVLEKDARVQPRIW